MRAKLRCRRFGLRPNVGTAAGTGQFLEVLLCGAYFAAGKFVDCVSVRRIHLQDSVFLQALVFDAFCQFVLLMFCRHSGLCNLGIQSIDFSEQGTHLLLLGLGFLQRFLTV